MVDEIFVSVIIPVYNAGKYIKKCLNSIINQSLNEIEIICINDGSTDDSLNILNKFANKDHRIKIFSTKNLGQGHARNLGLNEASGRYISFIDADDWIELNTLELLYHKANLLDLDLLFFQMVNYIEDSGNFFETELYNYKKLIENFNQDIPFSPEDAKDFLFDIAVCPVSKLYKKNFLENNNIFFPEGIIFEDNVFFYNSFLRANKISYLSEKFYYRRRHSESVTQNITEKSFDIVSATNQMLLLFRDNSWYEDYKFSLINHTFAMILEWFFKSKLSLCEEFYNIIKNEFLGFNELFLDFDSYLTDKNHQIFEIFLDNLHYLDFMLNNNLRNSNYDLINNCHNENYKVSVIIPIYNNEILIHRTIMSVLNQSFGFENIELLLIDDNSNDNTLNILNSYSLKYENIKLIHLRENSGSAGTPRNIGINESTADYIMFLDHDDFFEVDAIEILYSKMLETNADVVFANYCIVENRNFINVFDNNPEFIGNIVDNEQFIGFPPPSIWTKLFKKKTIIENKIFFPSILGEDAIFWNKFLINASKICYLEDVLIAYHVLSKSSTTNQVTSNYLIEGLTSEKYLYQMFEEIGKPNYFKYRCQSTLNFFLNQFSRSKLTKNEINNVLPCLNWFINQSILNNVEIKQHNLNLKNLCLNDDIDAIYELLNGKNNLKINRYFSEIKCFIKGVFKYLNKYI